VSAVLLLTFSPTDSVGDDEKELSNNSSSGNEYERIMKSNGEVKNDQLTPEERLFLETTASQNDSESGGCIVC
jgi:hypothetical protein